MQVKAAPKAAPHPAPKAAPHSAHKAAAPKAAPSPAPKPAPKPAPSPPPAPHPPAPSPAASVAPPKRAAAPAPAGRPVPAPHTPPGGKAPGDLSKPAGGSPSASPVPAGPPIYTTYKDPPSAPLPKGNPSAPAVTAPVKLLADATPLGSPGGKAPDGLPKPGDGAHPAAPVPAGPPIYPTYKDPPSAPLPQSPPAAVPTPVVVSGGKARGEFPAVAGAPASLPVPAGPPVDAAYKAPPSVPQPAPGDATTAPPPSPADVKPPIDPLWAIPPDGSNAAPIPAPTPPPADPLWAIPKDPPVAAPPPSATPQQAIDATIKAAADHRAPGPPVAVDTPVTKAIDKTVADQTGKRDAAMSAAKAAQSAVDANQAAQAGITQQEDYADKPQQIAAAEQRKAALAAEQGKLIGARDKAVAARDREQKTLDVVTATGAAVRYGTAAEAQAPAAKAAADRAATDWKALKAVAGDATPELGKDLTSDQRAKLAPDQQKAYDRYASSQASSNLAASAQTSYEAHAVAARLQQQVYGNDPAYKQAVGAATKDLNRALKPLRLEIAMPKSMDQALPGKANAGKRAELRAELPGLAAKAADAAQTADAAWDLNTSVVKGLSPDMVQAKAAALAAPNGTPPSEALVKLDNAIAVKGAYLQTRLAQASIGQAQGAFDTAKAALTTFDASHAFTDPQRASKVGAVADAQRALDLAQQGGAAAQADFVSSLGTQAAGNDSSNATLVTAAVTLQAEAKEKDTRLAVDTLTPAVAALKAQVGNDPLSDVFGGKDPRVGQLLDLESKLADATKAHDTAQADLTGLDLRTQFEQGLPTDLRDPQGDDAKMDFAQKQYEFYRDNPAALAGLDAKTQDALKQDPSVGQGDRLGSILETVGGAALFAVGTLADGTGIGAVVGVAAQVAGANMFLHGASDLITDRTTDGFIAQGLEAAGVSRSASRRWDTGINLAMSLPAGGEGLWAQGAKGAALLRDGSMVKGFAELASAGGGGLLLGDQAQAGVRQSLFDDSRATPYSTSALMQTGLSASEANGVLFLAGLAPALHGVAQARSATRAGPVGPSTAVDTLPTSEGESGSVGGKPPTFDGGAALDVDKVIKAKAYLSDPRTAAGPMRDAALKTLGLDPAATPSTAAVRTAFRAQVRALHPDMQGTPTGSTTPGALDSPSVLRLPAIGAGERAPLLAAVDSEAGPVSRPIGQPTAYALRAGNEDASTRPLGRQASSAPTSWTVPYGDLSAAARKDVVESVLNAGGSFDDTRYVVAQQAFDDVDGYALRRPFEDGLAMGVRDQSAAERSASDRRTSGIEISPDHPNANYSTLAQARAAAQPSDRIYVVAADDVATRAGPRAVVGEVAAWQDRDVHIPNPGFDQPLRLSSPAGFEPGSPLITKDGVDYLNTPAGGSRPAVNLFPRRSADLSIGMSRDFQVPAPPGHFVVDAHGLGGVFSNADGSLMTPHDLAAQVRQHPDYRKGQPVLAYSCFGGHGGRSAGLQTLATELEADVYGADAEVGFRHHGDLVTDVRTLPGVHPYRGEVDGRAVETGLPIVGVREGGRQVFDENVTGSFQRFRPGLRVVEVRGPNGVIYDASAHTHAAPTRDAMGLPPALPDDAAEGDYTLTSGGQGPQPPDPQGPQGGPRQGGPSGQPGPSGQGGQPAQPAQSPTQPPTPASPPASSGAPAQGGTPGPRPTPPLPQGASGLFKPRPPTPAPPSAAPSTPPAAPTPQPSTTPPAAGGAPAAAPKTLSRTEKAGRVIVGVGSAGVAGIGTVLTFKGYMPADLISAAYAYRGARAGLQAVARARLAKLQKDVPANLDKIKGMLVDHPHVFGLNPTDKATYAGYIETVGKGPTENDYGVSLAKLKGAQLFVHPGPFTRSLDLVASGSLASTIGGKLGAWLHGDLGSNAITFGKDALFDIGNNTLSGTTLKNQLSAFQRFKTFTGGKLLKSFPSVTMGTYAVGGAVNAGLEAAALTGQGALNAGLWGAFAYGAAREFGKNFSAAYPRFADKSAHPRTAWLLGRLKDSKTNRPLMMLGGALFLAKALEIAYRDLGGQQQQPSTPNITPTTSPSPSANVPSAPPTSQNPPTTQPPTTQPPTTQPPTTQPSTKQPPKKTVHVKVDSRRASQRTLTGIAEEMVKQSHHRLTFKQALDQIYANNPRFDRSRQDGIVTSRPPGDPDYLLPGMSIDTGLPNRAGR